MSGSHLKENNIGRDPCIEPVTSCCVVETRARTSIVLPADCVARAVSAGYEPITSRMVAEPSVAVGYRGYNWLFYIDPQGYTTTY